MQRLRLESLSVFGAPPVAFVSLGADLGCNFVTLARTRANGELGGYPDYSLYSPDLRRELKAVLRDGAVEMPLADGFFIIPERDIRSFDQERDLFCDQPARRFRTLRPLARNAHA